MGAIFTKRQSTTNNTNAQHERVLLNSWLISDPCPSQVKLRHVQVRHISAPVSVCPSLSVSFCLCLSFSPSVCLSVSLQLFLSQTQSRTRSLFPYLLPYLSLSIARIRFHSISRSLNTLPANVERQLQESSSYGTYVSACKFQIILTKYILSQQKHGSDLIQYITWY